ARPARPRFLDARGGGPDARLVPQRNPARSGSPSQMRSARSPRDGAALWTARGRARASVRGERGWSRRGRPAAHLRRQLAARAARAVSPRPRLPPRRLAARRTLLAASVASIRELTPCHDVDRRRQSTLIRVYAGRYQYTQPDWVTTRIFEKP